jgi:hypothetical protein
MNFPFDIDDRLATCVLLSFSTDIPLNLPPVMSYLIVYTLLPDCKPRVLLPPVDSGAVAFWALVN